MLTICAKLHLALQHPCACQAVLTSPCPAQAAHWRSVCAVLCPLAACKNVQGKCCKDLRRIARLAGMRSELPVHAA